MMQSADANLAWCPPQVGTTTHAVQLPRHGGTIGWDEYLGLLERRVARMIQEWGTAAEVLYTIEQSWVESALGDWFPSYAGLTSAKPQEIAHYLLEVMQVQGLLMLDVSDFPQVPVPDEEAAAAIQETHLEWWLNNLLPGRSTSY